MTRRGSVRRTSSGNQVARDQLQERRLSSTVGSHKRDSGVQVNRAIDVLVNHLRGTGVRKLQVLDLQHWRGNGAGVWESNLQNGFLAHLATNDMRRLEDGARGHVYLFRETASLHLRQSLLFGLCLLGELGRAVPEPRDVVLHVLDLLLLPLVPLHLRLFLLAPCLAVLRGRTNTRQLTRGMDTRRPGRRAHRIVVATILHQRLSSHMDDVRAHTVQEILIAQTKKHG